MHHGGNSLFEYVFILNNMKSIYGGIYLLIIVYIYVCSHE